MRLSILCLGILWGTVTLGWAEIYRWTDTNGQIHFTDNPLAIPPAYRNQVKVSAPNSAQETSAAPPPAVPLSATGETFVSPGATDSGTDDPSEPREQRLRTLEQKLTEARQQRQTYLDQIVNTRSIRLNPAFGRKRRQIANLGQELATVERQIDTLQADLQQAREAQGTASGFSSPGPEAPQPGDDQQNASLEPASVWQRRFRTARDRVRQAQAQRQSVVTLLSGEEQRPRQAFGRRGHEVVQHTRELQRLEETIHTAEAALERLEAEATQAGIPQEWRQ